MVNVRKLEFIMSNYSYVAVNPQGKETRGCIDVPDQYEALKRIKEMGLFPTKVFGDNSGRSHLAEVRPGRKPARKQINIPIPGFRRRVGPAPLPIFTRQLATLI